MRRPRTTYRSGFVAAIGGSALGRLAERYVDRDEAEALVRMARFLAAGAMSTDAGLDERLAVLRRPGAS